MKPTNKQSFYIERISRRNKPSNDVLQEKKEVVKSPPKVKTPTKVKTPSKVSKSKHVEPEKKTTRSTRGRPALDNQSEVNAPAISTQKIEQISDEVTDIAPRLKSSGASKGKK